jgi:hypothetical protein
LREGCGGGYVWSESDVFGMGKNWDGIDWVEGKRGVECDRGGWDFVINVRSGME